MPLSDRSRGREHHIPRSGDAQGGECRMPFIGPLKGRESRIPRSGDALGRESASQGANGQAYAPSEVSGILFYKPTKTG